MDLFNAIGMGASANDATGIGGVMHRLYSSWARRKLDRGYRPAGAFPTQQASGACLRPDVTRI